MKVINAYVNNNFMKIQTNNVFHVDLIVFSVMKMVTVLLAMTL